MTDKMALAIGTVIEILVNGVKAFLGISSGQLNSFSIPII